MDNEPDWINSTGIALRLFPAEINAHRSCIGVTSCRDRLLRQLNPLLFLLTIQIIYNDQRKNKNRNSLWCNLLYTPLPTTTPPTPSLSLSGRRHFNGRGLESSVEERGVVRSRLALHAASPRAAGGKERKLAAGEAEGFSLSVEQVRLQFLQTPNA